MELHLCSMKLLVTAKGTSKGRNIVIPIESIRLLIVDVKEPMRYPNIDSIVIAPLIQLDGPQIRL